MKKIGLLFCFLFAYQISKGQDTQRYISISIVNHEPGDDYAQNYIEKGIKSGCNAVIISVKWEFIYPSASSKPNWTQLDNQIKKATSMGAKVALRIYIGRAFNNIKGFWAEDECALDHKDSPLTAYWLATHFSFSHQPSIDKAKDFVRQVCERYKDYNTKNQILFVSFVNTADHELGYYYQNQQWPDAYYETMFDHNKWAKLAWRARLKEKYTTITTLNNYWGTKFKGFQYCEPHVNPWHITDGLRGQQGKDWYIFRHQQFQHFIEEMTSAIKSIDNTYKVATEYGAAADKVGGVRCSYGLKSLNAKVDVVKVNDVEAHSADFIRGSFNGMIFNEAPIVEANTPEKYLAYADTQFNRGYQLISIGINSTEELAIAQKVIPAVSQKWLYTPYQKPIDEAEMTYRLSHMIDQYDLVLNEWRIKSNNGTKKVKVTLIEDIIEDNKKITDIIPDPIVPVVPETPVVTPTPPPVIPPNNSNNTKNESPNVQNNPNSVNVVIQQPLNYRLPTDIVIDPDGYILYSEIVKGPTWLKYFSQEFTLGGTPDKFGIYEVTLRFYDNRGASADVTFNLNVVTPFIDMEMIEADYFDVPIKYLARLKDSSTHYLDWLPAKLNFIATCNVDSLNFEFILDGAYHFERNSDRKPFNVFGEGRGFSPPVGTYTLLARAIRKGKLVSEKTFKINFNSVKLNEINEWTSYPNPFSSINNIIVPKEYNPKDIEIKIINTNGVKSYIPASYITINNHIINLNFEKLGYAEGIYYIQLYNKNELVKVLKVVKN